MWLIALSLSPHNLHLLFCGVLHILALIWLVLMALFCAAIRRDSVSLLWFPFLSHVHIFSREMSLVYDYYYHYYYNNNNNNDNNNNPLGIVREIEVWTYEQMVYDQPRICHGEWDTQTLLGFWDQNGSPNLSQPTRCCYGQQKWEHLLNCELCCPSGPQSKIERIRKEG